MGKDIQAIYNDSWKTLVHNVLAVAAMESDNLQVQTAIKVTGHHLSDGTVVRMYKFCTFVHSMATSQLEFKNSFI